MKKIGILLLIGMAVLSLMAGCENKKSPDAAKPDGHPDMQAAETTPQFDGKVLQILNAGSFTYIEVQADTSKVWVAAPQFQVQTDSIVIVPEGKLMTDFYSKSLDRTFEKVYFVAGILTEGEVSGDKKEIASPETPGMPQMPPPSSMPDMPGMGMGMKPSAEPGTPIDGSGIERIEGGQTISELFAEKQNFIGKQVTLRVRIIKSRPNIMGKNWFHVKDSSRTEKDLTVTSQDSAEPGDTVVVTGILVADKDSGHGRIYELAIEDGKIAVEH